MSCPNVNVKFSMPQCGLYIPYLLVYFEFLLSILFRNVSGNTILLGNSAPNTYVSPTIAHEGSSNAKRILPKSCISPHNCNSRFFGYFRRILSAV